MMTRPSLAAALEQAALKPARSAGTAPAVARPTLAESLAVPGPGVEPRAAKMAAPGWTPGFDWDGEHGTITTAGLTEQPRTWDAFIRDAGLDPNDVCVIGPVQVRGWDAPAGGGDVVRMHYYRLTVGRREGAANIDDLVALVVKDRPRKPPAGSDTPAGLARAFVFAAGDLQLGKADSDGTAGTVERYMTSVDLAAARLKALHRSNPVGQVHIAWLGDCIEGFQSQGGANAWRTSLTLTEQVRLMRRLMLHTLRTFAPLAPRVTAVSVPGNHDEAVRFGGKGITRYDDSHAVDALVAVGDALAENRKAFGHVQLFTPGRDELTVTVDVAGTVITHAHGHQFNRGKHWAWWEGQTFGGHPAGSADLLMAGHLHHLHVDTSSRRTFLQVPALEAESTWFRHRTGQVGCPGAVTFLTGGHDWSDLAVV